MKRWLWAMLLWGVVLVGCGTAVAPADPNPTSTPAQIAPAPSIEVAADEVMKAAEGNAHFGLELYRQLAVQDGNLFLSPHSISAAMAMAYAGARGQTAVEMAAALQITLPADRLHPAFGELNRQLPPSANGDSSFRLNIANAMWGQAGYDFQPDFVEILTRYYGAGPRLLDFAADPEAATEAINQWVREESADKIKTLIPPGMLATDTRLVLTNAIYFKGQWVFAFNEAMTADAPFYLEDGRSVDVPMMYLQEQLLFMEGNGYRAVSLPYQDANVDMVIILPEAGQRPEVESSLSPTFLAELDDGLSLRTVDLYLPRFAFESEFSLGGTLAAMGMPSAFENADFSGMTGSRDLVLGQVVHKAFVAVDEFGTEAAAATAVLMAEGAMEPEEPVLLRVERPFLFLIRDRNTGSLLFIGRVMIP